MLGSGRVRAVFLTNVPLSTEHMFLSISTWEKIGY